MAESMRRSGVVMPIDLHYLAICTLVRILTSVTAIPSLIDCRRCVTLMEVATYQVVSPATALLRYTVTVTLHYRASAVMIGVEARRLCFPTAWR